MTRDEGWGVALGAVELRSSSQQPGRWDDFLKDLFSTFDAPGTAVHPAGESTPSEVEASSLPIYTAFDWSRSKEKFRRVCALAPVHGAGSSSHFADMPEALRSRRRRATR
jgi:hypothetical protein